MTRILVVLFILFFAFNGSSQAVQTFSGNVIDQKTENPVSAMTVQVEHIETNKKFEVETNKEGVFKFEKLPVGKYELVVTDKDYNKDAFKFEVTETHIPNLNFAVNKKVSWMMNWGDSGDQEHYWSHFTSKIIIFVYFACLMLVSSTVFYNYRWLLHMLEIVERKKLK